MQIYMRSKKGPNTPRPGFYNSFEEELSRQRSPDILANLATGRSRPELVTTGLYVLIWLIVFLILYIFNANVERGHHKREDSDRHAFLYLNTALNFCWLLFYANAFYFVPASFAKRKPFCRLQCCSALFGLVVLLDDLFFQLLVSNRHYVFFNSIRHHLLPYLHWVF